MTEASYPRLFSPFSAGRLKLANRLAMLPHGTAMVRDGVPTDDDLAYFEARVAHVGLVITGAMVAHPDAVPRERNRVEVFDRRVMPALERRAQAVKRHGASLVGQLVHVGRESVGSQSDFPPVSASANRSPRDSYRPHALDEAEIRELIRGFAESSANLEAAGYDGVELHAAHGYLIAQFLSPATNTRTDRWGGSADGRLRFLLEIVESVRRRCRDGFVLGVRLSADEETSDGLKVGDSVAIAKALAETKAVDYLNVTIGMRGGYVKDAAAPEAPAAGPAGIIKREAGLPVIVGQKIFSPETAERLLAEGAADLVGMARAFVADPEFAAKAALGRAARIRPCVHLDQDCRAFTPHLHCAVNPLTGRERRADFGPLRRAARARRVAVIGGGAAGMEAARTAAARGHAVTLFEKSGVLGGQFRLAASLPHRAGLLRFIDHLKAELREHAVKVELGAAVDRLTDMAGAFDAFIVATGASPVSLPPAGAASPLSWHDVVTHGAPAVHGSGRAVFADDGGGSWMSYGVVEALAGAGWRVTLATPSAAIGVGIPAESIADLLARLGRSSTRFRVLTRVEAAGQEGARLIDLASGESEIVPCDLLVVQTGRSVNPCPDAGEGLADVHLVGDCVTPRGISQALFEAQKVARAIE